MFMKVLCCILMLASYVVVYIQIRLEDKWYYGAIYEAEKIRYERACKEEAMTRKEAIEILDEQHLTWTLKKAEGYCMEVNEAIDMAIEALKEEPKSKVIAQINVDADEIVKLIEQNCDWKRPKGRWMLKHVETAPKYVIEKFYCSECGEGQIYGMPNFCPNCGADMGRQTWGERIMTREEAIKVLDQMKDGFIAVRNGNPVMYGFSDYAMQAFDMAIEALQTDLVRCEECKHRDNFGCHNPIWGDGWANYPSPYPRDEDFCSYGKRRVNDD